ncbi:MAG: carboxypeptidase regulatory-like domain-containing protein [FCB group bacterium]|nr:carboxypeptidase regulatory-like domain-containing protein [FCB group bacterium]
MDIKGETVLKKCNSVKLRVALTFALVLLCTQAHAINEGLIESPENMDSGITLTSIPQTIIWPGDTFSITWLPTDVDPVLRYASNPGGEIPENYPNSIDIQPTSPGVWSFDPIVFNPGFYYCILTSDDNSLTSMEFWLIRETTQAANMIWPFSDVNSPDGITSTTPEFTWSVDAGVPFVHLILSDQAFEIETDPITGELSTTGANVIWQVITSGNSIDYGTPDPSGNFTESTPPLIGDLTGENRPTYNWVALNNYGGLPELTSDVVGELMGFEVAVEPPFLSPILLEPAHQSVLSSDNILFEWTAIPEASSYHLYLTREEITPDSTSTVFTPVWYVQSTINATECLASSVLTSGLHRWKVIAENSQGLGTLSEPSDFIYSVDSAPAQFYVRTSGNSVIQGVTIDFIPIEGPTLPATLTDNAGYAERLMPYGTYVLELSKVGFVTTQTDELVIDDPETVTRTYNLLEASSNAQGTVVDNQGQTVDYADITATNLSTGEEDQTTTNNNGFWSLDMEPGSWQFQAAKAGYTTSPVRTITLQPESVVNVDEYGGPLTLTINLYELDGHVLNNDGEPVSLATVSCSNGIEEYQYTTSDNGYYTIDVAPGTWTLSASKPAFWLSSTLPPITVINSGSTNNIELTPSANIVSGVVFKGSVLANEDAVVRAVPAAGQIEETTVDGQGNFILSLATGEYQLNAYLTSYTSPAPINLSLGVGETISGINIVLTPNPSYITGKITYDGVQPVDSALVTSGAVTTYSNSQGNYTLNVPAGPRTVSASKTGYVSATSSQVNVSTGQTLANINLTIAANASTINGTVRSNGQPVYQAGVTARKVSTGTITTVQTLQNGTYSFGLSFGTYWIKAAKTGLIAAAPESLQVNINPGQTVNNTDFNLIPNIGYISGSTVYNNQAVPYATVNLVALDDPNMVFNTQSGYYGTFNISATPLHQYEITVSKAGYVSAIDTSELVTLNSTQEFTFNLEQLQSQLKGKVYALPDTIAIHESTVTAVSSAGATYTAQTNTVGSYTLGLNAGTYHVTAAKAGYVSVARDTTLNPGQIIEGFKFYLEPNFAGLQGFVRRASNQNAVTNALVSVTEVNTQTGASTYTDGTGYYSFDELFQGSYNIEITHAEYQTGELNGVVLLGGSTASQDVELVALTGSIAGSVVNSSGSAVDEVSITLERASGGVYTTQTGSNGSYIKNNLPSGNYAVSAAKSGYTTDDTTGVVLTPAQQLTGIGFQILRNDGVIVGQVVSTEGVNLGGVQVTASDGQGNFGNAVTASSGYYTIEDLFLASQYSVSVTQTGYTNPDGPITIQPSTPDSANFVMLPNNLTISGVVVNQNQTPKNNVPVQAVQGSVTLTNNTNSSGQFTINEAAPLTDYLVKTNSYSNQLNNTQIDTAVGVTSLTGLTLVVQEHSSSLSGLVTKSNGDPFTNIQVKARRIGGNLFTTNTGISGQWTISNLFDGNWQIYTSKVGYSVNLPDTLNVTLELNQSAIGNDFVLTEIFINISGTVIDDDGQNMADVPVLAWSTVGTDTAYTNASGAYSFADMTPSVNYQIGTVLPSAEYDNDSQDIQAEYTNVSGVNLEVVVHNASVQGLVEELGGAGLSAVTINLVGQAPLDYDETIVTNSTDFQFDYLHSGTYDAYFEKAGYLSQDTSITLNQSQSGDIGTITLQAVVNGVYGTVTDMNTVTPMENVVVKVENVFEPTDVHYDTTGSSGSYQVNNLTTNEYYNVTTYKKGFPDQTSNNFELTETYLKNINLTPAPNTIYGRVNNSAGVVQADAVVEANKFGASVYFDTTNYFGDYAFSPLPSGNYQLHADKSPLDSYFENTNLPSNGYSKFDLTVLNTAKLYGTVTYNGQAAAGAATVTLLNTVNQNILRPR